MAGRATTSWWSSPPRAFVQMMALMVLLSASARTAALPAVPDYRLEPRPLEPRSRPIEWHDINILHLTDVHSFVAGNRHEGVDADYGDLVSFINHMRDRARERGVELFVVNTGDLVDGTGMSDALSLIHI